MSLAEDPANQVATVVLFWERDVFADIGGGRLWLCLWCLKCYDETVLMNYLFYFQVCTI